MKILDNQQKISPLTVWDTLTQKNYQQKVFGYTQQGIIVHFICMSIIALITGYWKTYELTYLSFILLWGILPWFCILVILFISEKYSHVSPTDSNHQDNHLHLKRYHLTIRYLIIIFGFLVSAGYIGLFFFDSIQHYFSLIVQDNPPVTRLGQLAFYSGAGLTLFFITQYISMLIQDDSTGLLKGALSNLYLCLIILIYLCLYTICQINGIQVKFANPQIIIPSLCLIIGIELLIWSLLDCYRPGSHLRWILPFESRIIFVIVNPTHFQKIIKDCLDFQLGFHASESFQTRNIFILILKNIILSACFLWILSCIYIVESHEQAIIVRLGRLMNQIIEPGIHFKYPWLIDNVMTYNVQHIRKIHVGSHKPNINQPSVFKENTPILWTNMHGQVPEELMIISPSQHFDTKDNPNHLTRIPSVSLVGSDIYIEYVIEDLLLYVRHYQNADDFLEQLAKRAVSHYLFRFDIDTLLGIGRGKMSQDLKINIDQQAHQVQSGIKIIYVGFSGVHPPQQVAQAFHESVSAIQVRDMQIQKARQYRTKILSETAGSIDHAEHIISMLTQQENDDSIQSSHHMIDNALYPLILQAKGKVAVLLDLAKSYRWSHENREKGRAMRFSGQYAAFQASPKIYTAENYLSALTNQLQNAKKYMLIMQSKNILLRIDDQTATLPLDTDYPTVNNPDNTNYGSSNHINQKQ